MARGVSGAGAAKPHGRPDAESSPPAESERRRIVAFASDARALARGLLGMTLVRVVGGERMAGTIVEVEAYLGPSDRACHTAGGRRTRRNASMWLAAGHAYVYFIYGMHHCVNVVSGGGAAVLIRALRPTEGVAAMALRRGVGIPASVGERPQRPRRAPSVAAPAPRSGPRLALLCGGPARLAEAMAIDLELDGEDLRRSDRLWVERGPARAAAERRVVATPRIGVDSAGAWARRRLRFVLAAEAAWASRGGGQGGSRRSAPRVSNPG
ncbi:MAG TPA: DNA-3-methyladenine glycosylase [Phycisphaerales bacterium]|nr:DNA-3-methyladenine glycosylase [Phycisphaerales bacterium]HMP36652.1 DNA-3-methyladenine glycosylase [Phycisphaerales bacterium]